MRQIEKIKRWDAFEYILNNFVLTHKWPVWLRTVARWTFPVSIVLHMVVAGMAMIVGIFAGCLWDIFCVFPSYMLSMYEED